MAVGRCQPRRVPGADIENSRHFSYILVGQEIFPASPAEAAVQLANMTDRRIGMSLYPDGTHVSTVFLCLDHRVGPYGPPILFETMVFSRCKGLDGYIERYSTYAAAAAGHQHVTDMVTERLQLQPVEEESGRKN